MPKASQADPDAVRFGMVVRRLREQRGWTIGTLAHRAFLNATYLGVVESGRNVPSLSTILQIGDALGTGSADILREVERMRREDEQRRLAARKAARTPPSVAEDDITGS